MFSVLSVENPCAVRNGGCSQVCRREGDHANCACHPGYHLAEDGKTCKGKINLTCDITIRIGVTLKDAYSSMHAKLCC